MSLFSDEALQVSHRACCSRRRCDRSRGHPLSHDVVADSLEFRRCLSARISNARRFPFAASQNFWLAN